MSERIDLTLEEAAPPPEDRAGEVSPAPASAPSSTSTPTLVPGWFDRLKAAVGAAFQYVCRERRRWAKKRLTSRKAQAYAIKTSVEARKYEIEEDRFLKWREINRAAHKDELDHDRHVKKDAMNHEERMMKLRIQALEKVTALIQAAHEQGIVLNVNITDLTQQLMPQLAGAGESASAETKAQAAGSDVD